MNGNACKSEIHPVQHPDEPSVMPEVLPFRVDLEEHEKGISQLNGSLQPFEGFARLVQSHVHSRHAIAGYVSLIRQLQEFSERLARLRHSADFRLRVPS